MDKTILHITQNLFAKTLTLIGAERVHTVQGNVYRVLEV